jgi:endonuclease YncB( thermonuclease family)
MAETLTGFTVKVIDGDTLIAATVDGTEKIRLRHIDAPELTQAFGTRSKSILEKSIVGKSIELQCDDKKDTYNRKLCEIFVDKKSINARQVELGAAWVYTYHAPKNSPMLKLQETARNKKLGLWASVNPIAPWEYRHKK